MFKKTNYIFFALLFLYVIYRAITLSITYDEAMSFKIVMGNIQEQHTANHHWLNTWLMNISVTLLGVSEFTLRLPNVLSFALAAIALMRLQKHIHSAPVSLLLWLVLLNPYVLDFFSLARGYGLSIALMLMSLAMFVKIVKLPAKTIGWKHLLPLYSLLSLALYANFTLLNFYASISFLLLVILFSERESLPAFFKKAALLASLSLPQLVPVFLRLVELRNRNELYYGANSFTDMFFSLVRSTFYFSNYNSQLYLWLLYASATILVFSIIIVVFRHKQLKLFTVMLVCLLLILALLYLQHHAFDVLYPSGRTGIYLWCLLVLVLTFLLDALSDLYTNILFYRAIATFSTAILVLFIVHFSKTANTSYTYDWRFDACTKEVVKIVAVKQRATIGLAWTNIPAMDFYRQVLALNLTTYGLNGADAFNWKYEENNPVDTNLWRIKYTCDCNNFVLYENKVLSK